MALIRRDVILSALVLALALILIPIWIPLFRYISYAFVTGILTTIFTISVVGLTTSGKLQINTALTEYNPKFIALVESNKWKAEVGALRQRSLYRRDSLYPASFVISDGLDELLRLLQRDFIGSWYNRISRNPIFINEVDKNIRIALGGIRDRASAVDVVEMIVSRFVPIITEHLKDFYNAERVIRGKNLSRDVTESEELDLAIAGKYRHGRLHPAASLAYSDTKLVQQEYLRKTVEKLVPELLPESQIRSRAVLILIKEIVACAVLSPLMQLLSSPDTWNQLLEAYVSIRPQVSGFADRVREEPCYKIVKLYGNFVRLWISTHRRHQNRKRLKFSRSYILKTANESLKSSFEQLEHAIISQMQGVSGMRFPAS
jgi:sorting nexin-25